VINTLLRIAEEQGADLADWAALDRGELALYSLLNQEEALRYHSALVVSKNHHPDALNNLTGTPTEAYDRDYRRLNCELYNMVHYLEGFLRARGIACLAVSPSETSDTVHQRGLISHRSLAERAGLGVRGRNNLLVTFPYRSRLRLATLLTELQIPHTPKRIWPYPCGECDQCLDVCPAGALGRLPEDFRIDLCMEHLERVKVEGLSPQICGACLAVCPDFEQNTVDKFAREGLI